MAWRQKILQANFFHPTWHQSTFLLFSFDPPSSSLGEVQKVWKQFSESKNRFAELKIVRREERRQGIPDLSMRSPCSFLVSTKREEGIYRASLLVKLIKRKKTRHRRACSCPEMVYTLGTANRRVHSCPRRIGNRETGLSTCSERGDNGGGISMDKPFLAPRFAR